MSRELLDEVVDTIRISEINAFPDIIETILEYGFADGNDLCEMLGIDEAELDDLVCSAEHLTTKQWKSYKSALVKYLKKIRGSYERHYYSSKTAG